MSRELELLLTVTTGARDSISAGIATLGRELGR